MAFQKHLKSMPSIFYPLILKALNINGPYVSIREEMASDEQVYITVVSSEPHWDKDKTRFRWLDKNNLVLDATILKPKCELATIPALSGEEYKWVYHGLLSNNIPGIPEMTTKPVHCTTSVPSLNIVFESESLNSAHAGDKFKIDLIQRDTTTQDRETMDTIASLEVPVYTEPEIPKSEITFQVPNHTNVEITSDDNLIQLYHAPYTCGLNEGEDVLFHVRTRTPTGLKRLADVRLRMVKDSKVECLGLDTSLIWCGRLEAPGVAISPSNIISVFVGPVVETKEDALATLQERGFIPFTQLPPYSTAGGGWTKVEGIPEANYKKEWGDISFEMAVSGIESNPPNSTNAISWRYVGGTADIECKKSDPPTTGACRLRPLVTGLLDSAIDELYIGLPEDLTARIVDIIPSDDISLEVGGRTQFSIEVINWSWATGRVRARIEAKEEGKEPWERSEEHTLSSMNNIAINDVVVMRDAKYQLNFYAEHYDDEHKKWITDDMRRVTIATETTAMIKVNSAKDSRGNPFSATERESISILWDGKDCGTHPPTEIIAGSGHYCDTAKQVETSLGHHIIAVKMKGYITVQKGFENLTVGNIYELTPIMLKEGEEPVEVEMGNTAKLHSMIVGKEMPINTFCDESTGAGICDCTGAGSQEERIWCKNVYDTPLEPMTLSSADILSGAHPDRLLFKDWCGPYPTPESTFKYIKEWWSRAIAYAFTNYQVYVQYKEDFFDFLPAVIAQIQMADGVIVSTSSADEYGSPSPKRVYIPLDVRSPATQIGDHKVSIILRDPAFPDDQVYIGPFWYLKGDYSGGRLDALLYRDWEINQNPNLGGAIELQHWEVSNPPDESDIAFTKFYPEGPAMELPLSMLEQAIDKLPFMTEETYATMLLMQAEDKSTGKKLGSVEVWWDDCYCGSYGSNWEKQIGPGEVLGSKECKTDFGIHVITLKKDDYADFSKVINFKPGGEYLIEPRLQSTEGGEESDYALLIVNPAGVSGTNWKKIARIAIGKATYSHTHDTGVDTKETEATEIRFGHNCTFGKGSLKRDTPLGHVYNVDFRAKNYADQRHVFDATKPGKIETFTPLFKSPSYHGSGSVNQDTMPKNIYVNKTAGIPITIYNTGNVSADFTATIKFTETSTGKVYSFESKKIYIPIESEESVDVEVLIPEEAIPSHREIGYFDIDLQMRA